MGISTYWHWHHDQCEYSGWPAKWIEMMVELLKLHCWLTRLPMTRCTNIFSNGTWSRHILYLRTNLETIWNNVSSEWGVNTNENFGACKQWTNGGMSHVSQNSLHHVHVDVIHLCFRFRMIDIATVILGQMKFHSFAMRLRTQRDCCSCTVFYAPS